MTDTITLTGLVATEPRHLTTGEGLAITSFRLASSLRRFDRATGSWIDVGTNWYTVSAFRRLALGVAASVSKGDRVIVTGKLRLRDWKNAEKAGMTIEVDADALGHDLNWGTASYTRTMTTSGAAGTSASPEDAEAPPDLESATDPSGAVSSSNEADQFPEAAEPAGDDAPDTPF